MVKRKPGLYKTKHGQPFRILANGKARFVKKKKGGGPKRSALTAHTSAVKGFNKGLRRAGFNIR